MTVAAQFFAKVFGFNVIEVGNSEYYYFEQEIDNGIKNVVQIRKAKVDAFERSVGSSAGLPGPYIIGNAGAVRDGFPDHLYVCPTLGADVVVMYHRDGLMESGQAGNAAVC